jgi:hypothetical protein
VLIKKNVFKLNHYYSDIYIDVEGSEVTIQNNEFDSAADFKMSLIDLELLRSTVILYDSEFVGEEDSAL